MPNLKESQIASQRTKLDSFQPRILNASDSSYKQKEIAESVLPKGATLSMGGRNRRTGYNAATGGMPSGVYPPGGGGGGSAFYHMQRPYLPQIESPDRIQFPQGRQEANEDWRLFHRMDPIFGTAVDMYAEMMVSEYDIVVGDEKSREIKNTLEYMCELTNLNDRLKYMVREYLVMGECFPHTFFDEDLGVWSYIGMHNPDYIEVVDVPIIKMDPILYFLPDDNLRKLLSGGSPESREIRTQLPAEFVSKVMARQKIRLSSQNCSFIPRKMHPYEVRGTSIASRMFRIFMVEDAVYNSTIAMFRRAAAPVKVLKLGDAATGWLPAPGTEGKLLSMLNQAELDPQAYLVWNYGINFEQWGNQERTVTISKEHDTIEKVKLLALGLSKSFMTGEGTFASSKGGLQVFLRRLLSLRQFFESIWLYPKFFRPISEINEWVTTKPSEVHHQYRIKRTAQEIEEENLIMMPKLKWRNKLDATADTDLLGAYKMLEAFGIRISKSTVSSAVSGVDSKEELVKSMKEFKDERELIQNTLGAEMGRKFVEQGQQAGAKPPGGPGAGAKPPGAAMSGKPQGGMDDASAPPGSAEKMGPMNDSIERPEGGGLPTGIE